VLNYSTSIVYEIRRQICVGIRLFTRSLDSLTGQTKRSNRPSSRGFSLLSYLSVATFVVYPQRKSKRRGRNTTQRAAAATSSTPQPQRWGSARASGRRSGTAPRRRLTASRRRTPAPGPPRPRSGGTPYLPNSVPVRTTSSPSVRDRIHCG
jgi:hypothetical protein